MANCFLRVDPTHSQPGFTFDCPSLALSDLRQMSEMELRAIRTVSHLLIGQLTQYDPPCTDKGSLPMLRCLPTVLVPTAFA